MGDQRSLKSEYDYGLKKNFADTLGAAKVKGLEALAEFENHAGAKNLENQSIRSKYSKISQTTSFRKRMDAMSERAIGPQREAG